MNKKFFSQFLLDQVEFSTLAMVGNSKYQKDDAILIFYDDAVILPNFDVQDEFDKKLENLQGKARKKYVLENSQKKMLDRKPGK